MTQGLPLLKAKLTFDVYKLIEESYGFDLQKVREIPHSDLTYNKRKPKTTVLTNAINESTRSSQIDRRREQKNRTKHRFNLIREPFFARSFAWKLSFLT